MGKARGGGDCHQRSWGSQCRDPDARRLESCVKGTWCGAVFGNAFPILLSVRPPPLGPSESVEIGDESAGGDHRVVVVFGRKIEAVFLSGLEEVEVVALLAGTLA